MDNMYVLYIHIYHKSGENFKCTPSNCIANSQARIPIFEFFIPQSKWLHIYNTYVRKVEYRISELIYARIFSRTCIFAREQLSIFSHQPPPPERKWKSECKRPANISHGECEKSDSRTCTHTHPEKHIHNTSSLYQRGRS